MSFTNSRLHRRAHLLLMVIMFNQETEEIGKYKMKNLNNLIFIFNLLIKVVY